MNAVSHWLSKATLADWITNLSALGAVALLLLVAYGFRRYTVRPRTEPIDYMGTGIWMLALAKAIWMIFWDIIPDLMEHDWEEFGFSQTNVNWVYNIWVAIGAWYMLKGFYMLVEERSPGQYTILTAVFYPRQIRLSFVNRKPENKE